MQDRLRLRVWAGPLTIGSFAVVGVTGTLLFFHAGVGIAKGAHEWIGLLLVLGGAAHTAVNWKPFLAYFRKPAGMAIIGLLLAAGVISLGVSPGGGRGHGPRAFREVAGALEKTPLHVIAQVAKSTPETLRENLRSRGVHVRNADQTIGEIASENGKGGMELLGQIFGGE